MKKFAFPKLLMLITIPATFVTTLAVGVAYRLSNPIEAKTRHLNANENCLANFEFKFSEQPINNYAHVNLINKSDVELQIIAGENDYSPITYVDVVNRKCTLTVAMAEKKIVDQEVPFEIQFSYLNKDKKIETKTISELSIKFDFDPSQMYDEIHILDFNDLHGAAPGYGDIQYKSSATQPGMIRMMRDMQPIIDKNPGSIILSAGDNNSGNSFSTATHGETMFPLLKAMNVQYSAVGNHAFEWGLDYLAAERFDRWARTSTTSGKYFIASNILSNPNYKSKQWNTNIYSPQFYEDYLIWKNQSVRWADPYKLLNMKGHRVCIIGLTTQETYNDGNQDVAKHLSFIDYDAAVHYAKVKAYEDLGEENFNRIESFILLTHVESDKALDGSITGTCAELAKNITTDVDGIISGHSHKILTGKVHNTKFNKDIWVGQAGTAGANFLDTKITLLNSSKTGKKLSNITMSLNKVKIEYGGIDPAEKEDKEKIAIRDKAAKDEYYNLIDNPTCDEVKNVIDCYKTQSNILQSKLSKKLTFSPEGASYDTDGKDLGHKYIEFDNVVEQAGAWINKATLLGFKNLFCNAKNPAVDIAPSISFINQDSITHHWDKNHDVTLYDMFQIQTYENQTYYGYLNIEQIARIIDYLLSGKTQFIYKVYPTYTGKLNTNHDETKRLVDKDVDLESTSTKSEETSAFLCGPLQFYGMRFEIEKSTTEEKEAFDREYKLKWVEEDGITYPRIWFYDAVKFEGNESTLEDPSTWISAKHYIQREKEESITKFFPVTINNFMFDGQSKANRMFHYYMEYNGSLFPDFKPVKFSQITRDLLIEYANHWQEITPDGKFDVTEAECKQLVTKV